MHHPSDIMTPSERAVARARLARIRKLAWGLNTAFRLPFSKIRFGADTLIGLIPGAGDAVVSLLSLYIVYEGFRLGVSRGTIGRMVLNIAIEFVVGSIPVLGDVFDTAFKADIRNLAMIEREIGPL